MTEMSDPVSVSLPDALPEADTTPTPRSVLVWRAIFVLVPLVFIVFLALRLGTAKTEHRAEGLAPHLEFTTFDGETINLDDLRGKGVMVNFWASWCDPCREEAALLESTWRREKDNGIIFLGLDYLDQEPAAKAYLAEYDITYPNGPDLRSQVARRYGISGVPETFFIDPEGKIVDIVVGPIANQAQMNSYLDKIRPKEK